MNLNNYLKHRLKLLQSTNSIRSAYNYTIFVNTKVFPIPRFKCDLGFTNWKSCKNFFR